MSTQLTEKEIKIVQAVADGEKIADVAERMNLHYAYTKHILLRVRGKMGCETTYNLIATAIRQGIID